MNLPNVRVAIVDQQRVFVEAVRYRLERETGLEVVCAAVDAESGWGPLLESRPDVVILDADLSLGRAFDIASDLRREMPAAKVLFLVHELPDGLLDQALRFNVDGLLSRSTSLTDLVQALRKVTEGERPVSAEIAARVEFDPAGRSYRLRNDPASKGLTDRQLEILRHLARGDSVKAVARKLFLSPKSVDNQKFRIMSKIGVRDKVSLALFAVREGLIQP